MGWPDGGGLGRRRESKEAAKVSLECLHLVEACRLLRPRLGESFLGSFGNVQSMLPCQGLSSLKDVFLLKLASPSNHPWMLI